MTDPRPGDYRAMRRCAECGEAYVTGHHHDPPPTTAEVLCVSVLAVVAFAAVPLLLAWDRWRGVSDE